MDEEYIVEEPVEDYTPTARERRQARNARNIQNNEENIRAAAAVLKNKGIPYASAIAAGIDTADKISGGRTTRILGKHLNTINKVSPGGRSMQRKLNRMNESGATSAINQINSIKNAKAADAAKQGSNAASAASKSSSSNSSAKISGGEFKMEIPVQYKIYIFLILAGGGFIFLLLFVVLFNGDVGGGSSASGSFSYGGSTCTKINVVNTGCDINGANCTNIHNGTVALEDYIAGVVAAEVGETNNIEMYKTVALNARTYIMENINDNCTVDGNVSFRNYIDVNASPNSTLIKQAVEETKGLVLISDEKLIDSSYEYGYIEREDDTYYYIGYGYKSSSGTNTQAIPKTWVTSNNYTSKLASSNKNYDMTIAGAMYLITEQGYNHQQVIDYYYSDGVEIKENTMTLTGVEGYVNPTTSIKCSSPYGYRTHPVTGEKNSFHGGLDIGVDSPIYAAKSGTVTHITDYVTIINAKESNYASGYGYGNYVIITHEDGVSTLYAHMKYGSIPDSIYEGATVEQGQPIGHTGSTGRSTGTHLHYEVRINGERVNPADYIDLTEATGTCIR